jgi:hypothetical protein
MMPEPKPSHVDFPPLLRLLLFVGRPMGLTFVPELNVRVVYRMGQYAGVRGPGLVYLNRFTETQGPLVYIGGQLKEYEFDNIIARDVLPVKLSASATIAYDPALSSKELASVLTRIPKEAYLSIAGIYLRWGLLAAANQYTATELTQYPVRAEIETAVAESTNAELAFLGLKLLGKLRLTRVDLPATLAARHETIAQRRANILAGADFHPVEYRRALVSEVIEHLARSGGAESFLNFGEMLDSYAAERQGGEAPAPPRILEQPPSLVEEPPASAPNQPKPPAPGSRRTRSRL